MLRFVLTRIGLLVPIFLGIILFTFVLIRLIPGDPIEVRVGERGITPERHAELMHEMGLDRPLYVQFFDYVGDVVTGDLGVSFVTHRPVMDEFLALFPATLELATLALIFAIVIGVPAGVLAAFKRGSVYDHTFV